MEEPLDGFITEPTEVWNTRIKIPETFKSLSLSSTPPPDQVISSLLLLRSQNVKRRVTNFTQTCFFLPVLDISHLSFAENYWKAWSASNFIRSILTLCFWPGHLFLQTCFLKNPPGAALFQNSHRSLLSAGCQKHLCYLFLCSLPPVPVSGGRFSLHKTESASKGNAASAPRRGALHLWVGVVAVVMGVVSVCRFDSGFFFIGKKWSTCEKEGVVFCQAFWWWYSVNKLKVGSKLT